MHLHQLLLGFSVLKHAGIQFLIWIQRLSLVLPVGRYRSFFVGLLTRGTRAVRNRAQEMINNLQIVQCALRHFTDPTMNSDLASFFASRITDHRRATTDRRVQAHHLCNKEDPAVRLLFPRAHINFYQAVHISHIRLNGNEKFGRIRSILAVDDGEPLWFVAHLSYVSSLICPINESEDLTYDHIQVSSDKKWSFVLVEAKDFIEKSVFF